jgi:hypothetical protein
VRVANGSTRGALPNLITIGAQKCGTTSLHYYLDQHPDVSMSQRKELDFFLADGSSSKGVEWYAAQFDSSAKIRGESSPSYTNYPRTAGVPERIHALVPDVKLVYLVRDPIDRIVSNYLHNRSTGLEERSIEDALENPADGGYVARSKYFMQLEQYLAFFPSSRILVLAQEDLLHDRAATMREVFTFLGVDASFYDPRFKRIMHPTSHRRRKAPLGAFVDTVARGMRLPDSVSFQVQRLLPYPFSRPLERPAVNGALRERLRRELKDDADRLRRLTGKEFPGWCV